MRIRRFEWEDDPRQAASAIREWAAQSLPPVDLGPIEREVRSEGDAALRRLTDRFDSVERPLGSLRLDADDFAGSLARVDPALRESLELAATNIRTVAEAQLHVGLDTVELPQGQRVTVEQVRVLSAGVYAPGGGAAYPSSVLMGCIPAQVAGVMSVYLATPPRPDGSIDPLVLAAAELCDVTAIYPVGGAQAIFALAHGTETVRPVDVIAGPGNRWVTEAKRAVYGRVGIDSLAGPSELMVIADGEVEPDWVALDLCAQAEHGSGGLLVAVAVEDEVLDAIAAVVERVASRFPRLGDAPLATILVPDGDSAVDIANAIAPEHVEVLSTVLVPHPDTIQTAGCVFVGRHSATAFGDYVAGSNHILPTAGAGRFSGPLDPAVFRRATAIVEVPAEAAAQLAPHVKALAEAEGFPVHGESAMIRTEL